MRLVLAPAAPQPGDLVRLTGLVSGTPPPTSLSALTVTASSAAVPLAGTGLQRSFVARPGALAVSASVTTSEGTAADTLATLDAEPLGLAVFVELDVLVRTNNAQLTTYAVAPASATTLTFLAVGYNGAAWRILRYVNGTPRPCLAVRPWWNQ